MRDHFNEIPNGAKHLIDALSITTLLGTLTEMLPHVAALITIVWTGIRIFETATVRRWLGKE